MNHLVAEGPEDVLDVSVVHEQHNLVVVGVVVSSLDEQFVLWVWRLVQCDFGQRVYVELLVSEVLHNLLNPIVDHVYLRFVGHGKFYLPLWRRNGKYQYT